jgi:hypothetical protein
VFLGDTFQKQFGKLFINILFEHFFLVFSVPIGVPGATSGSMFTPIPVEVLAYEPEVVGLDLLHKTKFTKLRHVEPIPDLARVSEGTAKLEMMLDAVIQVTHFNLKLTLKET